MSRPLSSQQLRQSILPNSASANASASSSTASQSGPPALIARINEKRAELEDLKELRAASAQLADQMQALEDKLGTLSNGTEAVAAVLSNWHHVLRAINMASTKIPKPKDSTTEETTTKESDPAELPQTLVRIPAQESAEREA